MPGIRLGFDRFEIARGHDGFFRGEPDPRLLVAVYALADDKAMMLERRLVSIAPKSPYPASFDLDEDVIDKTVTGGMGFAVVLIALEEDSGDDVQRLYGELEDAPHLRLWRLDSESPHPLALWELDRDEWSMPQRAELEGETGAFSTSCSWDKWIGASAWVSAGQHPGLECRAHLRSRIHRNDWTVVLTMEHTA